MTPLSAADIIHIWERGQLEHPLDRALTMLVAASPGATRGELAMLPIGERDRRLLMLREQLFGPRLSGYTECSRCGERLEFELGTGEIQSGSVPLLEGEADVLSEGELSVRVRPVNSLDLVAVVTCSDREAARRQLIRSCVVEASRDGSSLAPEQLPAELLPKLEDLIAECDPGAEVILDISCPACTAMWQILFDIASYLWTEIAVQAKRLLREVHLLARAYGWREADILAMSAVRRAYYLDMVT